MSQENFFNFLDSYVLLRGALQREFSRLPLVHPELAAQSSVNKVKWTFKKKERTNLFTDGE